MKITAQQFISNNKDQNTFISVFKHYSNQTEKKVDKNGDLYTLISLSGEKEFPAERVSKFVWDGIVDGYLYSTESTTNDSLKDSIQEGVRKLKDLIRNDKDLENSGVNISFVTIIVKDEGIYIGNFGENEIYLYKDARLVNLTEILQKKNTNTAGIALSEDNLLLVSTPKLLSEGISNFVGLKNHTEIQKAAKTFGQNLIGSEGLLFFGNKEGNQEEEISVKPSAKPTFVKNILPKREPLKQTENIKSINEPQEKKIEGKFKFPKITFPKINVKEISEKIKPILNSIKKVFIFISNIFEKIITSTGTLLRKIWISIYSKLSIALGKKRWFKQFSAKVSQINVGKRPMMRDTGIRIDGYRDKEVRSKRFKIFFACILGIAIIIFGVNFTINAKKEREIHSSAKTALDKADELIGQAESKASVDTQSAETLLFQAKKYFTNLPEGMNKEDSERVTNLEGKVLGIEDSIYQRVGVSDTNGSISTFVDSRLAFGEGSNPTDIEIYTDSEGSEYLLVTDKGLKTVFRVSLYDKEAKKLADNESLVRDPQYISVGNKGVYVYDRVNGVLKAPFDKQWFSTFVDLSGLATDNINGETLSEFIVLTESDNVYFLSTDKNAILKSGFSYGDSYGLSYSYINNDNFSTCSDILADLSLYIICNQDPSLIRYNYSYYEQKQVEAPLGVGGFDGVYGKLTDGYTRDSLDYPLFLFDADGRRFFQFEKPMESGEDIRHANQILLENQYVYRGSRGDLWKDVKDFVVDANQSTMYVLDGSVIWKVALL